MTPEETFEMVVSKLEVIHRQGNDVRASCPAHGSRGGTLSVRIGEKSISIHCFAGCDRRDVLSSIGLTLKDIYFTDKEYNRTPPGEMHPKRKATIDEITMSLQREIFPQAKEDDYDGWTYNENRELQERLLSYCENYAEMCGQIKSHQTRLQCTLIRLDTLLNATLWHHDFLMGNKDKASEFLKRCDKTAVRQFVAVGIMQSRTYPKVREVALLDDFLMICSRGIFLWERGIVHTYA